MISEILKEARRQLAVADFCPPTREANLLLAATLHWTEAQVLARQDRTLSAEDRNRFARALARRLTGEPIAYILGHKEFYGRSFAVDNRVLIPRPETEHLVATALELPLPAEPTVLDVGTGSGCLACTLALERPTSRVVASDLSLAALAVASRNRSHYELGERLLLVNTDLAVGLDLTTFDLVLSNPPYVAPEEVPKLSREIVDFEPELALFADSAGLAIYPRLLQELFELRSGVWLVVELGAGQEQPIREFAADSCFELVEVRSDYAGLPRVALLQRR
jgi:release factor glutamine methyltransferase